jgi:hypothetical protein
LLDKGDDGSEDDVGETVAVVIDGSCAVCMCIDSATSSPISVLAVSPRQENSDDTLAISNVGLLAGNEGMLMVMVPLVDNRFCDNANKRGKRKEERETTKGEGVRVCMREGGRTECLRCWLFIF